MGHVTSAFTMNLGLRIAGGMSKYDLFFVLSFVKQYPFLHVLQSSLPENAVPFAFILYADKTHLSSAGTVKAYPVFARCGNLPVDIRNTDGLGGGRMVGWLPIVRL